MAAFKSGRSRSGSRVFNVSEAHSLYIERHPTGSACHHPNIQRQKLVGKFKVANRFGDLPEEYTAMDTKEGWIVATIEK